MLDIRIPISALFLGVGALLAFYGAFFHPSTPATANINLDLVWGLVMFFFGLGMGAWTWRSRRSSDAIERRIPADREKTAARSR